MSSRNRYDAVAIALHWLTALAIGVLLIMGWVMTSLRPASSLQFELFQWHKSVGVTVLALTLVRLGWRLAHRPPPLPETMPRLEKLAARMGHLGLYALLFALPLSSWLVVSTSPFQIPTILYGLLPFPHIPFLDTLPSKAALYGLAKDSHHLGAYAMSGLLLAHIGAALRHHFLLHDDVMIRMLPRLRRPRLEAMIAFVVVFAAVQQAKAADWIVDPNASHLGFTGSLSGTPFEGRFAHWGATIAYDPQHPDQARAVVTIDMTSATTNDPQKDQALPGPDWFDTATWHDARFEAAGFVLKGGASFETAGSLTIRNATKPVVLPFTLTLTDDTAHAVGRLALVRTEYGVGQGTWSTGQTVALDVTVTFDLTAHTQSKKGSQP